MIFDTVEVWGSSPHGPTISFNGLASTTSLGKAPNGSIKDACADLRDLIFPTTVNQDLATPLNAI